MYILHMIINQNTEEQQITNAIYLIFLVYSLLISTKVKYYFMYLTYDNLVF